VPPEVPTGVVAKMTRENVVSTKYAAVAVFLDKVVPRKVPIMKPGISINAPTIRLALGETLEFFSISGKICENA
jgi:hypothetical protein